MSIQPLPNPRPASFLWKHYENIHLLPPRSPSSGPASVASSTRRRGGQAAQEDGRPRQRHAADQVEQENSGDSKVQSAAADDGGTGPRSRSVRTLGMWVRESVHTPFALDGPGMAAERAALPVVVLVHGLVVSGTYLEPLGSCLAPYCRVFIPDFPGYGRSADELARPAEALTVVQQADLLAEWLRVAGLLDDEESLRRNGAPIFVGNSMGNNIIVELARRHPEVVGGCVLQGCIKSARQQSAAMQLLLFLINGRNEPANHQTTVRGDWRQAGWRRVLATVGVMRAHDIEEAIAHIQSPVLLLTGELDCVSNLVWNERLQRAAAHTNVSMAVVLDQPHTSVFCAPKIVAELVRDWAAAAIDAGATLMSGRGVKNTNVQRDERSENDAVTPAVPAPSHWLQQQLRVSDVMPFVQDAVGMMFMHLLLLSLLARWLGGASWQTIVLGCLLILALAVSWRCWHRARLLRWCQARKVPAWPCNVTPVAVPRVADFDSATGFLRATALAVRGHDCPFLGRDEFVAQRFVGVLLNSLPDRVRLLAYSLIGAVESSVPFVLQRVLDGSAAAKAVVEHYPAERTYPAVALGSSNGALAHLTSAMRIPWLPHTLMFGMAHSRIKRQRDQFPDLSASDDARVLDMSAELAALKHVGLAVLERNPDWQLHHMVDPNQDALMVRYMSYYRMKQRVLMKEYKDFLLKHLHPGGTILLSHCTLRWPCVRVSDRYFFQPGAYGGLTPDQYCAPNATVDRFIRRQVLHQSDEQLQDQARSYEHQWLHWNVPAVNCEAPEAEWGAPDSYRASVESFARAHGFKVLVIEHADPRHMAAPIAELFREVNANKRREMMTKEKDDGNAPTAAGDNGLTSASVIEARLPENLPPSQDFAKSDPLGSDGAAAVAGHACRLSLREQKLLVSQFIMVDPWWVLRTGTIPFWTVFSVESAHTSLKCYMTSAWRDGRPFRSASAALFSHGTLSIGLVGAHEWMATLSSASLLTHPTHSFHEEASTASQVQVRDDCAGGLLIGVRSDLFPRDFQSLMHMHDRMALVARQRYAMPLWQRQCIDVQHVLDAFQRAGVEIKQFA